MLNGQLYAVEFFTERGVTEQGYFVARTDVELMQEFDNNVKTMQFLGPVTLLGFYDSDAEDDELPMPPGKE